ncbi:mechanosensitive ion channel domain-containing protein [Roseospira navarrensis]|uniref:mechanosensitive ion channel domain-containing protein n=1 Tax=Roseospira navarrensis TaxID=140058 RepID=UPI001B86B640
MPCRLFAVILITLVSLAAPVVAQDTASAPEVAPQVAPEAPPGAASSDEGPTDVNTSRDAAALLAEILQDAEARQRLIDRLLSEAAAPEQDAAPAGAVVDPGATGDAAAPARPPSIARQVAERTQGIAEGVVGFGTRLYSSVADLASVATGERQVKWDRLVQSLSRLGIVAAATLIAFWVLKWIAARFFHAMSRRAEGAGWARRAGILLSSNLVDACSIILAWGGGYAFALSLGEGGRMHVQQSLFLNAFLMIELAKVVLRAFLAPRFGTLRWVPMPDDRAGYWYFWASRLIGLLGYGILLVVPIVNTNISFIVGRSLQLLIVVTAAVMAIAIVLRNRRPVRAALEARHRRLPDDMIGKVLSLLGKVWHLMAMAYVAALLVVWNARPVDAVGFMLTATVLTVVSIAAGTLAMILMTRAITGGIRVPASVRESLPLLEGRLNAFIPMILKGLRIGLFIAVLIAIGQAWHVIDINGWLATEAGRDILWRAIAATAIVIIALVVWIAASSWIEYTLNPNVGRIASARQRTLLSLFRNAFMVGLIVVTSMLALSELGVNIGPLLAGAGVLGLAIGFGAQKLVQDIITGAFIQVENAMNEGDVVTVGGTTGVVEKLSIRSVGLRDVAGTYHLIPFSSVDAVSNFMKGFAFHVAEIGVAYRENVPEVKALMQVAFERLLETDHGSVIIGELEMHGVTALGDSSVVVRARIRTQPGSQWAVGRAYNEIVKAVLDEHGVEIPFPHLTVYMGENKDGSAPPIRVRSEQAGGDGQGGS